MAVNNNTTRKPRPSNKGKQSKVIRKTKKTTRQSKNKLRKSLPKKSAAASVKNRRSQSKGISRKCRKSNVTKSQTRTVRNKTPSTKSRVSRVSSHSSKQINRVAKPKLKSNGIRRKQSTSRSYTTSLKGSSLCCNRTTRHRVYSIDTINRMRTPSMNRRITRYLEAIVHEPRYNLRYRL